MISVVTQGAIGDGVHDDTAAFAAAVAASREVYVPNPPVAYRLSNKITLPNGAAVFGEGRGQALIRRTGADMSFFDMGINCTVRGLNIGWDGVGTLPTTGRAIKLNSGCNVEDIAFAQTVDGLYFSGAFGATAHSLFFSSQLRTAIKVEGAGTADLFVSDFVAGGDASNTTNPMISIMDGGEAISIHQGDVIGGGSGLQMGAASYTGRNHPSFCNLANVYFDSSRNGSSITNCDVVDLVDCWFASSSSGSGLNIGASDSVTMVGGQAVNNYYHGVVVGAAAKRTKISHVLVACNSQGPTTCNGIVVAAGAQDFQLIENTCTNGPVGTALGSGHQQWGIWLDAGPSDYFHIVNNNVRGNAAGGITNQAYGGHRVITGNMPEWGT